MRVDVLLSSHSLSEAQRWQLLASLYNQVRSTFEGTVAQLLAIAVCAVYTGWWGFWALAAASVVVLILRLVHWRGFVRARHDGGKGARSPEAWARDFAIGICVMASLWGWTVVCITFAFPDMQLLSLVLIMQNGWLAAASIRNAASPSTVLGQTLATMVPTLICTLFCTSPLERLLTPVVCFFLVALLRIGRFYGAQMLSVMESEQRLAAANEELLKLSRTDGLTGIANRRAFDDKLAADFAFAVRQALDIAVVMIDVDYFKRYNDLHGHLAGDDCLRRIAGHVAGSALRASDLPARYGGEEFVVLLPGNGEQGATEVAESLRRAVYDANLAHDASPLGRVTVSVGVASMAPGLQDRPPALMTLADEALYKAKQGGRNQVCVAAPAQKRRGRQATSKTVLTSTKAP